MKKLLIALTLICSAMLVVGAQDGFAYPTYEGGCQACHGQGFSALNNHSIHSGVTCTACHPGAAGAIPIPSSNCIVCHPPANPGLCPLINDSRAGAAHGQSCLACHTVCAPPVEQDCFDQQDNDGDGFIDCADPDCDGVVVANSSCSVGACANTGQIICQNGQLVDTCVPLPAGVEQFGEGNTCNDGIDNDCDGLTDIADPGCAPPSVEQDCFDQQDNDGDGLTDCADPDCANAQDGSCDTGLPGICSAGTLTCVNGIEACVQVISPVREICGDGLDNDCDGLTDAADPDCEREIKVGLDIKPGSCPNPIGFADNKGVVPFAIMGTTDFDITQIDPASIRITREGTLGEVKPIRWSYEDVATPFEGELCDCHCLKGDGYMDLSMKVYGKELVDVLMLKEVAGDTIPLTVTGKLKDEFGGTPIKGQDCVRVLKTVLLGK